MKQLLLFFFLPSILFAQEQPPLRAPLPEKHEPQVVYKVEDTVEVVTEFPSKDPVYPGGELALMKYMNENLEYPPECADFGIQGRVYLSFIIEKDGSVSNVKILRGIHSGLDQEAKRLIKEMPLWKPGENANGIKVRTLLRIPVSFRLN